MHTANTKHLYTCNEVSTTIEGDAELQQPRLSRPAFSAKQTLLACQNARHGEYQASMNAALELYRVAAVVQYVTVSCMAGRADAQTAKSVWQGKQAQRP